MWYDVSGSSRSQEQFLEQRQLLTRLEVFGLRFLVRIESLVDGKAPLALWPKEQHVLLASVVFVESLAPALEDVVVAPASFEDDGLECACFPLPEQDALAILLAPSFQSKEDSFLHVQLPAAVRGESQVVVEHRKDSLCTALPVTPSVGRAQATQGGQGRCEQGSFGAGLYGVSLARSILRRSCRVKLFPGFLSGSALLFQAQDAFAKLFHEALHRRTLLRGVGVDVKAAVDTIRESFLHLHSECLDYLGSVGCAACVQASFVCSSHCCV